MTCPNWRTQKLRAITHQYVLGQNEPFYGKFEITPPVTMILYPLDLVCFIKNGCDLFEKDLKNNSKIFIFRVLRFWEEIFK